MILNLREIIDIIIMCLALGFIFKDSFKRFHTVKKASTEYDPIKHYSSKSFSFFNRILGGNSEGFIFAIKVIAPAIILHELGHKFVAMSFGFNAEFYAATTWLMIGIVLKLMNAPIIFFVPAFVAYSANTMPYQSFLISFAGPAMNLLLFLVALFLIKFRKKINLDKKYLPYLALTKNINLFLFGFNMIPFGMFDGAKVFNSLFAMIKMLL